MYFILKKGKLKEIIEKIVLKYGTQKNAAKAILVPKSSISLYYLEQRAVNNPMARP